MIMRSQGRDIWRRLAKNKAAIAGLCIIVLFFFVAVFAYVISPDSTPDANRMTVELAARKPGFTQMFLKLPAQDLSPQPSFLSRLLYGRSEPYDLIPIQSF